jgi:hypothetical protein
MTGEGSCSCKIEDFEHNSFDIDLVTSPPTVKVELAGELAGMKPSAISENPIVINDASILEYVETKVTPFSIFFLLFFRTRGCLLSLVLVMPLS